MTCRFCKRPLTSEESRRNGAGHTCIEKHRGAPNHPELFDTLERQERPVVKQSMTTDVIDWDKLTNRVKPALAQTQG